MEIQFSLFENGFGLQSGSEMGLFGLLFLELVKFGLVELSMKRKCSSMGWSGRGGMGLGLWVASGLWLALWVVAGDGVVRFWVAGVGYGVAMGIEWVGVGAAGESELLNDDVAYTTWLFFCLRVGLVLGQCFRKMTGIISRFPTYLLDMCRIWCTLNPNPQMCGLKSLIPKR
ncbi:hypothetical protein Pyn_02774 [Prunus yedoensis var. nudiflora]|uniref:Transmembrane protein n=1 Tax=Prunus yedoensis var. nudiflora TaxID=2094558 RepID=A0A314YCR3_PRUYE|nr:hypothetical protein Pyn_02774 [Prunus yedoensis var. nudiflora]